MCNNQFLPKGLSPLESGTGIAEKLTGLRQSFEAEGAKLCAMHVPAVLLLSDVCDALGLSEEEWRTVLGPEGLQYLEGWRNTPVRLNGKKKSALMAPGRSKRG